MQKLITAYYKSSQPWNVLSILYGFQNTFKKKWASSDSPLCINKKQTLITDYYSFVKKPIHPAHTMRQMVITDFYKSSKN